MMNEKSLLPSKNLSNCNALGRSKLPKSHPRWQYSPPSDCLLLHGLKWYCHQGNILWNINSMINKILSNCIVTPPNLHNHFHVFLRIYERIIRDQLYIQIVFIVFTLDLLLAKLLATEVTFQVVQTVRLVIKSSVYTKVFVA